MGNFLGDCCKNGIVSSLEMLPVILRFISPELQDGIIPDLASREGQVLVEGRADGISLVILDNLSCLVRSVKENEGEGWLPIQGRGTGPSPKGYFRTLPSPRRKTGHATGYVEARGCARYRYDASVIRQTMGGGRSEEVELHSKNVDR